MFHAQALLPAAGSWEGVSGKCTARGAAKTPAAGILEGFWIDTTVERRVKGSHLGREVPESGVALEKSEFS